MDFNGDMDLAISQPIGLSGLLLSDLLMVLELPLLLGDIIR